jgi:hypothetical protein
VAVHGEHTGDAGLPPLKRPSFRRRVLAAFLRQWGLILVGLLLLVVPPFVRQRDANKRPAEPRRQPPDDPNKTPPRAPKLGRLRQALRAGAADEVLAFFRDRALTDDERGAVLRQLDQLGNESFAVRQKAAESLAAWGPRAAALLRRKTQHPDPEVAGRATACLRQVLRSSDPPLLSSAIGFLSQRRPAGAAAALLTYLPYVEDEGIDKAVRTALAALAVRDGKADEALVKALTDSLPERRAAAGVALCQPAAAAQRPAVLRLLHDPDPDVRRRVALALVPLREKEAVPTLIELLGVLPPEQAWPVLELLEELAGADAPVSSAVTADERRHCRDAWATWWKEKGDRLDLGRALTETEQRRPKGHTLIVQLGNGLGLDSSSGQVVELGPDWSLRWQINALDYPLSAQALPGNRVLIAEYQGQRVTERGLQGEVLWSKEVGVPLLFAQRLPNDNTFLVMRNRVVEVDAAGKEVFSHCRRRRDLASARPCVGGGAVLLTDTGDCIFLDGQGKETGRFATGAQQVLGAGLDVLPNKRVLVPHYAGNKVVEYAADGKVLWQARVASPTSVQRLPGGRTLVASTTTREVVELDRGGREVAKHSTSASPVQATRH